jgi:arylsulfatase A
MIKSKLILSISIAFALLMSACSTTEKSKPFQKPNIVIIYGDDVGYGDVGAYGSKLIPTPNIDKLVSEGLQFTDGHCTAATCSPSRFALLTGVYGFRHNVDILPPNAPLSIPTDIMTLPKMLQKAGYATGVVGKWHLGIGEKGVRPDWNAEVKPGPLEIGFDYSFLLPSTNDRVPCVYLEGHKVVNLDTNDPLFVGNKKEIAQIDGSTQYADGKENREAMTYYQSTQGHNNSVINGIGRIGYMAGGKSALWNDETMADKFVEKAKQYMTDNKDKPFFLYFASQDIHVPRTPHPRFQGKTSLGYRGDAMVQFDWVTGQLLETIEKLGLKENTIVIFSSDNGPVYDDGYDDGTTVMTSSEEVDNGHDATGIYRGGKYQIYDGGTRVPFIVSWPGKIKPGTSNALVNQVDFLGSFANMVGVDLGENEGIDSRNTLDAFLGKSKIGLPSMLEEAIRKRALRRGEWKYIPAIQRKKKEPIKAQLYNVENDPGEQNNVVDQHPELEKSMEEELKKILNGKSIRNDK